MCYIVFLVIKSLGVFNLGWFLPQDFKDGKVDTAFIPKHEDELAAVSIVTNQI